MWTLLYGAIYSDFHTQDNLFPQFHLLCDSDHLWPPASDLSMLPHTHTRTPTRLHTPQRDKEQQNCNQILILGWNRSRFFLLLSPLLSPCSTSGSFFSPSLPTQLIHFEQKADQKPLRFISAAKRKRKNRMVSGERTVLCESSWFDWSEPSFFWAYGLYSDEEAAGYE